VKLGLGKIGKNMAFFEDLNCIDEFKG